MAGLVRSLRRTFASPHSRSLAQLLQPPSNAIPSRQCNSIVDVIQNIHIRKIKTYDEQLIRLLHGEIQYEVDRLPSEELITEAYGFTVDSRPEEMWVRLEKKFGDEEIKVDITMVDGSLTSSKYYYDTYPQPGEEQVKHITMVVNTLKDDTDEVLEFVCSAWPDKVEINKVYVRRPGQMPDKPYLGPLFKVLDDNLQVLLYEYLKKRGITNDLSTFLHQYVESKDRLESLRWMRKVLSFIKERSA